MCVAWWSQLSANKVIAMWLELGKRREGGTCVLGPAGVSTIIGGVVKGRNEGVAKVGIAAGGRGGKAVSIVMAIVDLRVQCLLTHIGAGLLKRTARRVVTGGIGFSLIAAVSITAGVAGNATSPTLLETQEGGGPQTPGTMAESGAGVR